MPRKRLYVLRHAKSSWDDPALADRDRPLAQRGWQATERMHGYLESHGIEPELVLCSPARRAQETLEGVRPGGDTLIEEELYGADAGEVVARLQRVAEPTASVMVIGHNPTMQTLVLTLADPATTADTAPLRAEVADKFPTGALAELAYDGPWRELSPGAAELTAFVRPKALHDGATS